jgi:NADPH:quinone reductase-like Zn-dependent oxidoreductase
MPLAGLTAYQGLHDHLQIRAGDTVLVLAGTGGVGGFAIQLARIAKARALASASDEHASYVGELGGEFVPRGEELVKAVRAMAPEGLNALFDLVGGVAARDAAELLVPGGSLISIVDADGAESMGGRYGFVRPDPSQLAELSRLVDTGALRVQLAETFPFERAPDALELLKQGHVQGKLAIELDY